MTTVNMLEAKTHLSRLVEAIESGAETEIIIARNGKAAARLTPLAPKKSAIVFGIDKGGITAPDDIDADNSIIEKMFYGESILETVRRKLGGTVRVAPGFNPATPTGEVWDAEG
jgi:antitoxin (DNA-binding transcriptional repressor) of toxin-antitoxin stability system